MEATVPTFGAREIIGIIITITAVIAFLLSVIMLAFSQSRDPVDASFDPGKGGFHLNTQNLSIVTLCVSALLLAVMGTAAFADNNEQWVYLGSGYEEGEWNFVGLDGSDNIKANDVAVATRDVNIREAAFGTFTRTWLGILSPPEPKIVGKVSARECVKIIGFKSVGLNKVWMQINPVACP